MHAVPPAHHFVGSATGRWLQKVEKVGVKGALGSAIAQQFQH